MPIPDLYSPFLSPQELHDLQALASDDLQAEIALLRVVIRRVVALSAGVDDLQQAIAVQRSVGLAAGRLGRLVKTQTQLTAQNGRLQAAVSTALAAVLKEMVQK